MFAGEQDRGHLHVVPVRRAGRRVTHPDLYARRVFRRVFEVGLEQHERRRVVSEVLTHARQVVDDRNAERFEVRPRAYA